jgi:hypothetical protein
MLKLIAIERPPRSADQRPQPVASVKFGGKVGDFTLFEITAYLNQGLTDDVLVRDAQALIRDAVAVLSEELNKHWPEGSQSSAGRLAAESSTRKP